jgi:hypothetical protein
VHGLTTITSTFVAADCTTSLHLAVANVIDNKAAEELHFNPLPPSLSSLCRCSGGHSLPLPLPWNVRDVGKDKGITNVHLSPHNGPLTIVIIARPSTKGSGHLLGSLLSLLSPPPIIVMVAKVACINGRYSNWSLAPTGSKRSVWPSG